MNERLARQIAFLVEADKLKSIIRRTPLVDSSRLENSAEHSWHLVLTIMVMREYRAARRRLDARDGNGGGARSGRDRRRRRLGVRRRRARREGAARTGGRRSDIQPASSRSAGVLSTTVGRVRITRQRRRRDSRTPSIASNRSSRTRTHREEAGGDRRWCARRSCAGWRRLKRRCRMYGRTCSTWSSRSARPVCCGETETG